MEFFHFEFHFRLNVLKPSQSEMPTKQQGVGDPHSSTYNFCSCFYVEAIQAHDDHFISIQKHFFHYELATVLYLLVCNNAPWSEMACKG